MAEGADRPKRMKAADLEAAVRDLLKRPLKDEELRAKLEDLAGRRARPGSHGAPEGKAGVPGDAEPRAGAGARLATAARMTRRLLPRGG